MTPERAALVWEARRQLRNAINQGKLPKAKTLKCVDCGYRAHAYDHRDYRKPRKVDPVCQECHRLRGVARPLNGLHQNYRTINYKIRKAALKERRRLNQLGAMK